MSTNSFVCSICGNTDTHSIGYLNGKPYCRRCISFRGEEVEHKQSYPKKAPIHLEYELSTEQKELSDKLVKNYKKGIDSLVYAVCGSGKTEITLQVIKDVIMHGKKVGFALPRRDVAIELCERFKKILSNNTVVCVYGGHHDVLEADLIVLTTHQLFRYKNYFDLLIIDEIDAFPFNGDEILNNIASNSKKGNMILMSATASEQYRQDFINRGGSVLELNIRFHYHPLPVPQIIKKYPLFKQIYILRKVGQLIKEDKPLFIFVPTIKKCEELFRLLNVFYKCGNYVHSKRSDRKEIIDKFRRKKYKFLVTTAVLERGVTVEDLQVIIYDADHSIYDAASLIQIAGRVGRKKNAPKGDVYFVCQRKTQAMDDAITSINESNKNLQNLF